MAKTHIIAASLFALALPAAAGAQPSYDDLTVGYNVDDVTVTGVARDSDARSKRVALNDLDLRRDRDVRVADGRIRNAAADVCGVGRENGSVISRQDSGCFNEAFGSARVALNGVIADSRAG